MMTEASCYKNTYCKSCPRITYTRHSCIIHLFCVCNPIIRYQEWIQQLVFFIILCIFPRISHMWPSILWPLHEHSHVNKPKLSGMAMLSIRALCQGQHKIITAKIQHSYMWKYLKENITECLKPYFRPKASNQLVLYYSDIFQISK